MTIDGVSGKRGEPARCLTPKSCPENEQAAARKLAERIALDRSAGRSGPVVKLLHHGTPADLRAYLLAFYQLRDVVAAERSVMADAGAPLVDRIAAARISAEIEEGILEARARLSSIARNRGRPVVSS